MSYDNLVRSLTKKVKAIRKSQSKLDRELLYMEKWLTELTDNMESVDRRIAGIESKEKATEPKPISGKPRMSEEDFKAMLEKLLQNPMEDLGDKISRKILEKLKDLKGVSGRAREAKIKELKDLADDELVDLSKLFREKVESNIEDIGVEEKETKGIDKSLERLRRMRQGKDKPDENNNGEKQE